MEEGHLEQNDPKYTQNRLVVLHCALIVSRIDGRTSVIYRPSGRQHSGMCQVEQERISHPVVPSE